MNLQNAGIKQKPGKSKWRTTQMCLWIWFQVEVAPRREFICFATLFDASMISKDYKGKEVFFELSMGGFLCCAACAFVTLKFLVLVISFTSIDFTSICCCF